MSACRSFLHNWGLAINEACELEEIASCLDAIEKQVPNKETKKEIDECIDRLHESNLQLRVALSRLLNFWDGTE